MYVQTKKELLDHVVRCTLAFDNYHCRSCTANQISKSLNISRNLASQYLNELFRENLLVKVNSRPVYFLHRKTLERNYSVKLDRAQFYSLQELMSVLTQHQREIEGFTSAIGHSLSLRYCVEQCKAAMKYPSGGLPVLLIGSVGTGKSYFAGLMHEYALCNGLAEQGGPLITVNCSEFSGDPERMATALFGCAGPDGELHPGALELSNGGVLFLDEVHALSPECQEKLSLFMDSGTYHRVGEREISLTSTAKLVFATTHPPEDALLNSFLRRIPITTRLPDLSECSTEEKEDLIICFFKRESRRIGQDLLISRWLLNALLNHTFVGNVGELEKTVRNCCAAAYLSSDPQENSDLCIFLHHLPQEVLNVMKIKRDLSGDNQEMIRLSEFERDDSSDHIIALFDNLLDGYLSGPQGEDDVGSFIEASLASMNAYHDYIVFERQYADEKIRAIERVLFSLLESTGDKYSIILPPGCAFVMARSLYTWSQTSFSLRQWEAERNEELNQCLSTIRRMLPYEHIVVTEIAGLVLQNLDMQLNRINQIFLALNIHYYNNHIDASDTLGIILCHGYASASSIADSANKLLGSPVFLALDVPLNTGINEITLQLKRTIQKRRFYENIILLVDIGSLESIGGELQDLPVMNIGIINNISTRIAVDVGSHIIHRRNIQEILEKTCGNTVCSYKLISNQKRTPAVLFTSEMGSDAAERMVKLFRRSMPKTAEIQLFICDYESLVQSRDSHDLIRRYQVLCVVGSFDPGLEVTPFVSLDTMVASREEDLITRLFAPHLNRQEIALLHENLIKNFSLQNIVQNITILNANMLLDQVESAVRRLQLLLGYKMSGRTMIGLYVHICCLIERLVTKTPIDHSPGQDIFEREHADFIKQVAQSFDELQQHYRVSIPVSEIMFLYQYIQQDELATQG